MKYFVKHDIKVKLHLSKDFVLLIYGADCLRFSLDVSKVYTFLPFTP